MIKISASCKTWGLIVRASTISVRLVLYVSKFLFFGHGFYDVGFIVTGNFDLGLVGWGDGGCVWVNCIVLLYVMAAGFFSVMLCVL